MYETLVAVGERSSVAGGASEDAAEFLGLAHRIATRVSHAAMWNGDRCTWIVTTPDFAARGTRRSLQAPASAPLYQGTAGIGYILAEVGHRCADPRLLEVARAALRHAAVEVDTLRDGVIGLYSGRSGVALALAQVARLTGDDELAASARAVLAPLIRDPTSDGGLDVMAGAAGAIPVLLRLTDMLAWPELTQVAEAMGEALVRQAVRGPFGWAWSPGLPTRAQHLLGYSHGASGFGSAFVELFACTGRGLFRHAAEQAFAYERRFFDAEEENWPDFRHHEITEILTGPNGKTELVRRIRSGQMPEPYSPSFMAAWCHGAPGIGLSRLRAHAILGDDIYRIEAEAAIRTTLASIERRTWNFSLCHGLAGNCDTLLVGALALYRPELHDAVAACVREGRERYEDQGRSWPCGTMGGQPDPSLMVGELGVAYLCLRLADPAFPSLLHLTSGYGATPASSPLVGGATAVAELQDARAADVSAFFGRTLAVVHRLTSDDRASAVMSAHGPDGVPTPARAFRALEHLVAEHPEPCRREQLADAFAPERARFLLAASTTDLASEMAMQLAREQVGVGASGCRVRLADDARLVATRWDWDAWLETDEAAPPALASHHLAYRVLDSSGVRRLGRAAALLFERLVTPCTVEELLAIGSTSADAPHDEATADAWRTFVLTQLREGVRAGVLIAERMET